MGPQEEMIAVMICCNLQRDAPKMILRVIYAHAHEGGPSTNRRFGASERCRFGPFDVHFDAGRLVFDLAVERNANHICALRGNRRSSRTGRGKADRTSPLAECFAYRSNPPAHVKR